MGGSKKQTVSHWYHPVFQLALHQAPYDALLKIRGGDVDAWAGQVTESGPIEIDARNIWGGEEKEGGIEGTVDVMFGEMDSQPNAFIQDAIGPDPSGHNGVALLQFNAGRYGAGNPYPKRISVLSQRIYEGWLDDECWYPETAAIGHVGVPVKPAELLVTGHAKTMGGPVWATARIGSTIEFVGLDPAGGADLAGGTPAWADGVWGVVSEDGVRYTTAALDTWQSGSITTDGGFGQLTGGEGGWLTVIPSKGAVPTAFVATDHPPAEFTRTTIDVAPNAPYIARANGLYILCSTRAFSVADNAAGPYTVVWSGFHESMSGRDPNGASIIGWADFKEFQGAWYAVVEWHFSLLGRRLIRSHNGLSDWSTFDVILDIESGDPNIPAQLEVGDDVLTCYNTDGTLWTSANDWAAPIATGLTGPGSGLPGVFLQGGRRIVYAGGRFHCFGADDQYVTFDPATLEVSDPVALPIDNVVGVAISPEAVFPGPILAINPAHVIYDSLTYLQEEPVASINDASFRAAAARLYSEGFGICTRYNHDKETVEQFRRRILDLIGAECSRDPVTGLWHLDLIRGVEPDQLDDLLVLTDDDILDFQDDPTTLDDAVNQVSVKWFDPETKQERITAPVHSLGLINAMGRISAETKDYTEVPVESLADRLGARDLHNKGTPTWRQQLTTNRKPYRLRIGQYFRLQAPKRGIADMVCLLADRDKGTLQSGAIKLLAVQDVFSMPDTTYVVGQPPEQQPSSVPVPVAHQRAFEAPYVELAGAMSPGDLAALDDDAAYMMAVGTRPGVGHDYALLTRPEAGEFERIGIFDWCPSATVVEAAGYTGTAFSLAGGSNLSRVDVGTAAMWGDELVRVDSLDLETGAIALGRGCGDTVPTPHAAGERIYFYDAWSATDQVEYATAETAEAKLLPRTGTAELAESDAALLSVTFDQRAARPYPPADVRINGLSYPAGVSGDAEVTAVHRDRVAQADQLVDQTVGDIGPEPGTTYVVRNVDTSTETETYFADGITAFPHVVPAGDLATSNRLEVYSVRDGLESWQRVIVPFSLGAVLLAEDTAPITAEDGDPIVME